MKKFKTKMQFEKYCAERGLVTLKEAAEILGIKFWTLRQIVDRGELIPSERVLFAGPGPLKLFNKAVLQDLELRKNFKGPVREQSTPATLVVGDIFEVTGKFSDSVVASFRELDALVRLGHGELIRVELELVEDLATNTKDSLTNEHFKRIAVFLRDKVTSVL